MAILGGGGHSANDPIYVDTLESFKEVFEDETNKYTYIAFPEVYDGPKVIDLRARGWNPINIGYRSEWNANRYIYFNGWTILGLSIMDSWFFSTAYHSDTYRTYIYDLIMKNTYILAVTGQACCFCESGTGVTTFIRCKFSALIDANNSNAGFMWPIFTGVGSGSTGRKFNATQCSFNIELHTQSTGENCTVKVIGNVANSNTHGGTMINCIFYTKSPFYRLTTNQNYGNQAYIYNGIFRFCKWIGNIDLYRRYCFFVRGENNSAYNVVDTDFYSRWSSGTSTTILYSAFSSGINLINSDRVHSVASVIQYSLSHCTKVTQAQMTDQDYLNSIEFICGETPSDAPPHKRRLIFITHLHERRCA